MIGVIVTRVVMARVIVARVIVTRVIVTRVIVTGVVMTGRLSVPMMVAVAVTVAMVMCFKEPTDPRDGQAGDQGT